MAPWNHNSHYHDWLLKQFPSRFGRALDVGCGEGLFASRLAGVADRVDAIDVDREIVAEAARVHPSARITFRATGFLEARLPADAYDVVISIATVHHMDFEDALAEMKRLLRPGGCLAVLGLYVESSLLDYATAALAIPGNLVRTRVLGATDPSSATVAMATRPPALSLPQIRRSASAVLPGARVRRRLYWRYSLVWRKP